MLIVSDTTPIISFIKLDLLGLLEKMFGQIYIPRAVFDELTTNPAYPEESELIRNSTFIRVGKVQNEQEVDRLMHKEGLDIGLPTIQSRTGCRRRFIMSKLKMADFYYGAVLSALMNDVFAKHAWYFRNSLVRANYRNVRNGVYEDMSFLEAFLRNLLMGEKNELKNRYMHIRWNETTHLNEKQHIQQHIQQHIGKENDILTLLDAKEVSYKMKNNILRLHDAFGMEKVFGRGDVVTVLGITERPASTLLGKMFDIGLTKKITGAGKGRYRFIV